MFNVDIIIITLDRVYISVYSHYDTGPWTLNATKLDLQISKDEPMDQVCQGHIGQISLR